MTQATTPDLQTEGPYFDLTVSEVVQETHDACSLVFEIPEPLQETFRYRAGQFLTFRIEVDGKRLVRCYSLASSPVTDSAHKVTVKRVDEGRVSNQVNDAVRAGSVLEVMKPAGVFCLQAEVEPTRPVVLFSGGSGITPVISIIKTALATTERSLHLLYANRDEASVIFRAELDALVERYPGRLQVEHSLDDRDGFVDVSRAKGFVGERGGADFYICGPGPFMDVAEQALQELGVAQERIFIERFESPSDEPVSQPGEPAAAAAPGASVVEVVLDGKTTELSVGPDETILQAARRAGLEPPFACEEAYCGCCMAKVAEGDVEMKMNDGGIDQGQIDKGWVLTCQGLPRSARCKVEYPD